jgi:hypothetical protein
MEKTFVVLWSFEGIQDWESHISFIPDGMSDENAIAQATAEVINSLTGDEEYKREEYLAGVLMSPW